MKNKNKKVKKTTTTTTTTVVEEMVNDSILETHYLLILDKSGSMGSVRKATIDNFNEQVQTIKGLEKKYPNQKYYVSLITFSNDMEFVFKDLPASEVKELTYDSYSPDGGTALLHAMGQGITLLEDKLTPLMNEVNSGKEVSAIVVVMTDGGENASYYLPEQWTQERVKNLVEKLNENKGWTINFLGANQDSFLVGSSYGFAHGNTMNFAASTSGVANIGQVLSRSLNNRAASYTTSGSLDMMQNDTYFSSVVDNTQTVTGEETDTEKA